jgi:hypothetical protein
LGASRWSRVRRIAYLGVVALQLVSRRSAALVSGAVALTLTGACPPQELRVVIDAEDLSTAVGECTNTIGTLDCGPDVDTGRFVAQVGEELRVRKGACVAARIAFVARPEEPDGEWPRDRSSRSACVPLSPEVALDVALAAAVETSLSEGLSVSDVESAEDAVFVMGLFGSDADDCGCGEESVLFACSRLGPGTDDSSRYGIACTQCSGRKATENDSAPCARFADAKCFFEGCMAVFEDE